MMIIGILGVSLFSKLIRDGMWKYLFFVKEFRFLFFYVFDCLLF